MKRAWKLVAVLLAIFCGSVLAQPYPVKPIRTVVPYPAGGYYDMIGRTIGQRLSRAFGQPVIVENKVGANGIIGAEFTAKAAPDGYTLLVGGIGPNGINPGLYKKLPYDAARDFAPIVHISSQPNILVVPASSKLQSVQELIALARAKPGHVTYASNGIGSSQHLSAALFELAVGIKLTHVPYKGGAPALTAMLAAEVDQVFGGPAEMLPHIRSGKLRPLAVTSRKRLSSLPEIPTMMEAGVPGYEVTAWFGYFAPAGTPQEVLHKLNSEINAALQEPDVRKPLEAQGSVEVIGGSPEQFGEFVKGEIAKWADIVQRAGISRD